MIHAQRLGESSRKRWVRLHPRMSKIKVIKAEWRVEEMPC
jgi:hypothetical protein